MIKVGRFFGVLALLLASQMIGWSASMPADVEGRGWDKLGAKKVNYGLDRDVIHVTAKDGLFTSVKLKVRKASVNIHRFDVHYGNGEVQRIEVKKNIRKGGSTRTIDINGGKRAINKVVFWYDTKNVSRNKATVELWGKH